MMDQERLFIIISELLDDGFERDIFDELSELDALMDSLFDDFDEECCRYYFNTLKKTVELCHQMEMVEVPEQLHYKVIKTIEKADALPCRTKPARRRSKKKSVKKPSRRAKK
jgi:hypothetical protein